MPPNNSAPDNQLDDGQLPAPTAPSTGIPNPPGVPAEPYTSPSEPVLPEPVAAGQDYGRASHKKGWFLIGLVILLLLIAGGYVYVSTK